MTDFYADLHIHSRFSRATSKSLTLPLLAAWAQIKGLTVVGTGDFTHPQWREELLQGLAYDEETALYTLKEPVDVPGLTQIPLQDNTAPVYFMIQGEISSIYKRDGKVRKVHNMVFMPNFSAAQKFCRRLEGVGNLQSDGRPILGLDSRDLLEMVLETDPAAFLIPAHIWTPWYSLFGSKSGFDSIEECFGDLSDHIFALETGLSSDPAMNRLVSALDTRRLVSNSDAHSAENLGREANRFGGRIHYDGIFSALRQPGSQPGNEAGTSFLGTVEFFPQEGKYFADGHRKCGLCQTPEETRQNEGICPVCGKKVTVGVLNRVLELADRETPVYPDAAVFQTLVPLPEIVAEIFGQGVKTRKVRDVYARAIGRFGSELSILTQADTKELNRFLNPLGEAVERVRKGAVTVRDGYDGEYGVVRVFSDEEQRTIVREVGEASRPQKIQAQGLTLLGDTAMPKKKGSQKNTLETPRKETVEDLQSKQTAPSVQPLQSGRVDGLPGESSGHGKDGSERLGVKMNAKENAGINVPTSARAHARGNTGDSVAPDSGEEHGHGVHPPAGQAETASDGQTDDSSEAADSRTDDASVNFIFSEMDEENSPEPLPFLPLEQEDSHPPLPEESLNFEQQAAAFVDTQPTLLMAGAGTGKTFTLFARLCRLLRQGTLPRSILVATFTRKTATEMDKKLLEIFGEGVKLPVIDTLYALALDLWHKTHADVPVLLSEESARQVFAEANIEEDSGSIKGAWEAITLARLLLQPVPEEYTAFASRYTAHKSAWNLADYTDLLEFWLEQARSGIFKPLWDYVLIDEIQELAPLGRALVSALVPPSGRGFFGVGDVDQTLYAVPGDSENVVDVFKSQWPDLQVFSLMTGFRGQKGLLDVAQSILHSGSGERAVSSGPREPSGSPDCSNSPNSPNSPSSPDTPDSLDTQDSPDTPDTPDTPKSLSPEASASQGLDSQAPADSSGAFESHVSRFHESRPHKSREAASGKGGNVFSDHRRRERTLATGEKSFSAHGESVAVDGLPGQVVPGVLNARGTHGAHGAQGASGASAAKGGWDGQARVASVQTTPACIHVFKAPTGEAEVQWITDKISVLLGGVTSTPEYAMERSDVFMPPRMYKPEEVAVLVRSKHLGHEIRRSLARIGIGVSEPQSDVFWADPLVRILLQLGCRMLGISLMEREGSDIPDCPDKVVAKGPLAMSAFLSTIPPFDLIFWHSKAFRELVRVYDQSGGWAGLITWIHLQNDLELVSPNNKKVQILTLHAAKGREFPVVFLPCLEEGIIPSAGPLLSGRLDKAVDVEGERRLLYMGAARAQEALFMSHSSRRCLRGADVRLKVTRFLDNLPESLVTVSTLVEKTHHQEEQLNLL